MAERKTARFRIERITPNPVLAPEEIAMLKFPVDTEVYLPAVANYKFRGCEECPQIWEVTTRGVQMVVDAGNPIAQLKNAFVCACMGGVIE